MKKRKDGRYILTYQHDGIKKYFTAKTQIECKRKRQAYIDSLNPSNGRRYDSSMLLKEWAITWLMNVQPSIEGNTFKTYESAMRLHILPTLGNYPLCNIQPMMIRDLVSVLNTRLGAHSVRHVCLVLGACLKQAVIDDLLQKTPMRGIKLPKMENEKPWVPLTEDQLRRFFKAITNAEHTAMFQLAATSGIRRSELLGLRFQDVDMLANTITINQAVVKVGAAIEIKPRLKTKSSRRTISLPIDIMQLLRAQIHHVKETSTKDKEWQNHSLLFPGRHGVPRSPDWVTRLAKQYATEAGIPAGFTLHHLRHTNATLLLAHGIDYKTVQSRLGHSTAKLTLDTYSHLVAQNDQHAAAVMGAIL